jgi:uncharacterized membrane protein
VVIARWTIGMGVFAFVSAVAVTPSHAQLRVCNKSGQNVDVAVGYDAGRSGFMAEGWYAIKSGRCVTVYGQRLSNRYYYLYAEGHSDATWDGTDDDQGIDFCVSRKVFKHAYNRYGSNAEEDCEPHSLESKRFFLVDVGEYRRWTQTLDPASDAPTPTPQEPEGEPPVATPPPERGSACERFPNLC